MDDSDSNEEVLCNQRLVLNDNVHQTPDRIHPRNIDCRRSGHRIRTMEISIMDEKTGRYRVISIG